VHRALPVFRAFLRDATCVYERFSSQQPQLLLLATCGYISVIYNCWTYIIQQLQLFQV